MSRKDLERLFSNHRVTTFAILDMTGGGCARWKIRLRAMAFKGIPARLSALLLLLAEQNDGIDVVG